MKYKNQNERRKQGVLPCHVCKQEKKKDAMHLHFKTLSLENIPETTSVFLVR